MFDIAGGVVLIDKAASMAATQAGKKVANKALTKTACYPVAKKVAAMLGQKITRQTVGSAVTKVVLGVVAGTLTYAIFLPMGQHLTDVFVNNLNGTFAPKKTSRTNSTPNSLKNSKNKMS